MSKQILWRPSATRQQQSNMAAFIRYVNAKRGMDLPLAYLPLHDWSVSQSGEFWCDVWDFHHLRGSIGEQAIVNITEPPGARFFPDGELSFTDNLLRNADDRPALIVWDERGRQTTTTRAELREESYRLAAYLQANGIGKGDRVGAVMPNNKETVVALLATAALGAIFSSCSSDFGAEGTLSRLGQIQPKALIAATQYRYGGRVFDRRAELEKIITSLPSLQTVICTGEAPPNTTPWQEATSPAALTQPTIMPFNSPLAVLYSSGTTGAPKCIVHSTGGALLQHVKELSLHTDIRTDDKVFYFTTCGWMMWNWLVSVLALEATIVLYDGNPMHSPGILWDMAEAENLTVFGASAKYFDSQRKAGIMPNKTHALPALRTICSTGSPLSAESFAYIYKSIKDDVHLASISGGTDIISCFVLGNPFDAVCAGEIQCAGLGMDVKVFDDNGETLTGQAGELVCTSPAPCMPLRFWNDNGEKYHAAYFQQFANVWTHGDQATKLDNGSFVIHGRSDTTLNPSGVRIGTAEIYHYVEALEDILEALAVGQQQDNDERIVLFVRLRDGVSLDEALQNNIRTTLRQNLTPRHVPAKILAVADFPRTRSGKISEIAVRETIHHRPIKNATALANPESLNAFMDLVELQND